MGSTGTCKSAGRRGWKSRPFSCRGKTCQSQRSRPGQNRRPKPHPEPCKPLKRLRSKGPRRQGLLRAGDAGVTATVPRGPN